MTDCAATPTTFVEWDTALLSGTSYTALPVTPVFNQISALIYVPFTYPDLIMTRFRPGDEITLVNPQRQAGRFRSKTVLTGFRCTDIFLLLFQESSRIRCCTFDRALKLG